MEGIHSQKAEFFSQLISCGQALYYWEFEPTLKIVQTSCPNSELIYSFLSLDGCWDHLLVYIKQGNTKPLLLSDSIGLSWIVAMEVVSNQLYHVHMIGPAFTSDVSYHRLERELSNSSYPKVYIQQFFDQIHSLPIISLDAWAKYGLMLHFYITGEKLEISDFNYQTSIAAEPTWDKKDTTPSPKGGTWLAEQMAMKMIEEGQLNYQKAFNRLSMSAGVITPTGSSMSTRQLKNYMISFITLATRAAIRGGLDAETAYYIGEHYIVSTENASNLSDLTRINATMYEDFIHRVNKVRTAIGTSTAIQACCNYIDLHIEEKLSMKKFAAEIGYSEYYLSQKFKKEIGMTVAQYMKERRIERAKLLLKSSNQSIQDICDILGFCNPSYFTDNFHSIVGMTPSEYRSKNV